MTKVERRLILTGVSGALGRELVAKLELNTLLDYQIVVFTRQPELAKVLRASGHIAVDWDISDRTRIPDVSTEIGFADRACVVHMAADVAWHKTYDQMKDTNVAGTANVAELLRRTSTDGRMIYVSTAFTSTGDWTFRNAYERTKAEAEVLLRTEFPDVALSTFSCSLVVGRSDTGAITRFHGLYPLLYVLDTLRPPALVGKPEVTLDIVPLDWVVDELFGLIRKVVDDEHPLDVVASLGSSAPLLSRLVPDLIHSLNRNRAARSMTQLTELPIIPPRRWHFLINAMDNWKVDDLPAATIWTLRHIMDSYEPYLISDTVRQPQNLQRPSPEPSSYLDQVVDFWFESRFNPKASISST